MPWTDSCTQMTETDEYKTTAQTYDTGIILRHPQLQSNVSIMIEEKQNITILVRMKSS